ncbi:uncharacterized protein MELLADRAFT_104672 [Melampsora larici-populina 98AG31]|uniref:Uncharacterized protein n=1 Tax=Melampsora larici-populina (strain 98AG31 / pathotype 3-4-7) TaxID=747676 RepID=F4RFI7_MELLP|nr:uncharacterized protein MELLADRAFT_104672 [Melampsora larici-populina 98AG31]EGG08815.1 hypothetical protein MELLADRAFT_104672 [Melampsora larici-populina 98AG31]
MDSEQFHQQIDDSLRNNTEEGKGKEVESREETTNVGEGVEEGGTGVREDEQPADIQLQGLSGQENAPPEPEDPPVTTRQSKRKKAPPKPFPPPTVSKAKVIGPIRIKRLKQASKDEVEGAPSSQKAKKNSTPQQQQTTDPTIDKPIVRQTRQPAKKIVQEADIIDEAQTEDEETGSEDEARTGRQEGQLWQDTNPDDGRPQMRTVGGIALGDIKDEPVRNAQTEVEHRTTDSVAERLDEEIDRAFMNHDRTAYGRSTEQKRACRGRRNRNGGHWCEKPKNPTASRTRHDQIQRQHVPG